MNLNTILLEAGKKKIAVIGDLIEDVYIKGTVDRISPEAPIPLLVQKEQYTTLGGAGNVWKNLVSLGVDAHLYCNCNIWSQDLINDNIHINSYPHARKIRMVAGTQQLLRVDLETPYDAIEWHAFNKFSWWRELEDHFGEYDCIVMVDYFKGVLSDSVINGVLELATYNNKPVVVDTKKAFERYHMATVLKCNKKESEQGNLSKWPNVAKWRVVTNGEYGISVYNQDGSGEGSKGYPVNIVDVCGAGDTVTAILSIMIAIDREKILPAIDLANIAASEVCQHFGVVPITKETLIRRFNEVG